MRFPSIFPGYRTCSFQYQFNSLGSICPAAITALVTIQTHKQSLSNQVPVHSWVQRVHIQVKCLAQGHSAKPRQPKPAPKTLQSKVAGHIVTAMTRCMYMEYIYFKCIGTLSVVTSRELVLLSRSFTSHSMSARRLRHLRGHASHARDIQSPMLKGEK